MRWEEAAVARSRWAQALLDEGAARAVVAVPLRSAYRAAAKIGATPLRRQAEALATLAKIPLEEAVTTPHDRPATPLRSLTKREQEVLAHLVAGRTYAEIASARFISEKTSACTSPTCCARPGPRHGGKCPPWPSVSVSP
jgi:ATP/maltotriose-dependent transcriptional regulator MalT